VKDAYVELSALLYAPPSEARDLEIAAHINRDTDFDELTRRAFGEPCPKPGCTDHWAELTAAQRAEVVPLFAAVTTSQWTAELARAFSYDIDVQKPSSGSPGHERDTRVRVLARQKGSTDKAIAIDLFLPASPPYKLVDLEVGRAKLSRSQYKQFDRTLTNRDEGYPVLLAKLKKKLPREAGVSDSGGETKAEEDPDMEPDEDPDGGAAPSPAAAPPAAAAPVPTPTAPSLPWGKIAFGGALTLAIGVGLGRMRRKERTK